MSWQPIKSAPPYVPIIVTDGKRVTVGQMRDQEYETEACWDILDSNRFNYSTFRPDRWMEWPAP